MSCRITQGIENSCDDVLRVGGLGRTFWVGYLSDLDTPIALTQAADIASLDFGSYGGLVRFDGRKFSHQYTVELVSTAGGNKSFRHTFVGKVLSKTTADNLTLKRLALADDIFIVVDDNNGGYAIIGAGNGLAVDTTSKTSGQTGDSDSSTSITLSGSETTQELIFNVGGAAGTLAYIEALETQFA
jgi:hypothetical protein